MTAFSHESNGIWEDAQVLVLGEQYSIEATRGDSTEGYVAIDTIITLDEFNNCDTKPHEAAVGDTTTTPSPPVVSDCNFEDNLCGWKTIGPEEFLFKRVKGSDQDGSNGPDADHEGNKESKFVILIVFDKTKSSTYIP